MARISADVPLEIRIRRYSVALYPLIRAHPCHPRFITSFMASEGRVAKVAQNSFPKSVSSHFYHQ